jgi:hypothetical protein
MPRMHNITRALCGALAIVAVAAPAAVASPVDLRSEHARDAAATSQRTQDLRWLMAGGSAGTSDLAERTQPQTGAPAVPGPDLRSADARDAGPVEPSLPGPPTWPSNPKPISPAPVDAVATDGGDDDSPLVYILAGLIASGLVAGGMGYAVHTSRRARQPRIGV